MTFDCITEDKNLWAVRYDGEDDNVLFRLFDQWDDAEWLRSFFTCHFSDLVGYFRITNINQAVLDTMDDRDELECLRIVGVVFFFFSSFCFFTNMLSGSTISSF